MRFPCKYCGQRIRVDDAWAGRPINCPSCTKVIVIPESAEGVLKTRSRTTILGAEPEEEPSRVKRNVPKPSFLRPPPDRTHSSSRRGRTRLVLVTILVLAGGGFGYAMIHFKEGPSPVVQRLIEWVVP